jgi:hypothetical protein
MHACISAYWSARIRCASNFRHLARTPHHRNILRLPWASRRWCRSRALARAGHTHTHMCAFVRLTPPRSSTLLASLGLGGRTAKCLIGQQRWQTRPWQRVRAHHCVQNICPAAIPAPQPEHWSAPGSMIAGGVSGRGERKEKRWGGAKMCGQHRAKAQASRSPCRTWPSHSCRTLCTPPSRRVPRPPSQLTACFYALRSPRPVR